MNDFYLKIANSAIGGSVFEALSLPKPVQLSRNPNESFSALSGRIILGCAKGHSALKYLAKGLDNPALNLLSPNQEASKSLGLEFAGQTKLETDILSVSPDKLSRYHFNGIVFDASGINHVAELKTVYSFLSSTIARLKKNGRIIIIGKTADNTLNPEEHSCHSALSGFVRSLAKEIGKKGATANLLLLEKGAERYIHYPAYFLLSQKSAFISGQTLTLSRNMAIPRTINWPRPLQGKFALVTGAAQGIGAETSKVLARDGATIIGLDIPANKKILRRNMESIGGHAICLDLAEEGAAQTLLGEIGGQVGVIDIVVHNAGITRDKTLKNMPVHFWEQVMSINLSAIVQINELLLKNHAINPKGRIVCVSSIAGIAGNFGQCNYAASKAGVAGYVQRFADKLEQGMTINAVAPGFIETDMTAHIPLLTRELGRRLNSLSQGGLPLDVAEAIACFCHPAAQALNGNVLRVCGQSILGK